MVICEGAPDGCRFSYRRLMRVMYSMLAVASAFAIGMVWPSTEARADEQCDFVLSGPELTRTSYGTELVTATLSPGACPSGRAITKVMVCVAASGTAGRCKTEPGPDSSRVLLEYAPRGGVYVVTGRGCSYAGDPVVNTCTEYGPLEARL